MSVAPDPHSVPARKAALRREILTARREAEAAADPCRAVASWTQAVLPLVVERTVPGDAVAAFLPTAAEPPLDEALERVADAGRRLVVPRVLGPHRLEWVAWSPGAAVRASSFGVREPLGAAVPPEAFRRAALKLVPALAVGTDGVRLGYGGGFYDVALENTAGAVAVVFSREVLPAGAVPAEPHDARLAEAVTEQGLRPLR